MPRVLKRGQEVATFPTRAECIVFCMSQPNYLVFDHHNRRRNQLLPGVKIEGKDYEEEQHGRDNIRL